MLGEAIKKLSENIGIIIFVFFRDCILSGEEVGWLGTPVMNSEGHKGNSK